MRFVFKAGSACAAVLILAACATGDVYEDAGMAELRAGIEEFREFLEGQSGPSQIAEPRFSVLGEGESEDFEMLAEGGQEITLAALCDEACGDLDLYVFDEDENLLAEDIEQDSRPIVSFATEEDTAVTVRLSVESCASRDGICRAILGTFAE